MAARELSADVSDRLLGEIRTAARSRGLLDLDPTRYAGRALMLMPPLVVALLLAWTHPSDMVIVAMSLCVGFMCVQLGLIAHDAGHGALARSDSANAMAGHLAFTVLNGLGFESWCVSHAAHHAGCQDESADPDMWVDTVLSLTPDSAKAKTGIGLRMLPYQASTLWFMALFFAHSLRIQSLGRSYREWSRYHWDAILLPLHYGLWFMLPVALFDVGWGRALAVYMLTSAAMGLYLAVLFWVNHIGMPVIQAEHSLSFVEQQVVGSRNVLCRAGLDWFFGGLNYQIEHHLVPDCSGRRLRELRAIVRPLCVEAALPYREEGFRQALASVTRHVREIARESKHA
jgi:fatty acid desaturase